MNWEIVTAVSTAIIAVAVVFVAFWAVLVLRSTGGTLERLERLLISLEEKVGPTLDTARLAADEGRTLVGNIREEVDGVVSTSKDLRERIEAAADAVEDRLVDLDALVDVAHSELEETVLDVAAALRTTRRSTSILGKMRRALRGGRRR